MDEVLIELGPKGVAALRVMHLDGPASDRVPLRLAPPAVAEDASEATEQVKKSTAARNASISGKRDFLTSPSRATAHKINRETRNNSTQATQILGHHRRPRHRDNED